DLRRWLPGKGAGSGVGRSPRVRGGPARPAAPWRHGGRGRGRLPAPGDGRARDLRPARPHEEGRLPLLETPARRRPARLPLQRGAVPLLRQDRRRAEALPARPAHPRPQARPRARPD
ncbi:MAG: DNA/RNA helicases, SNF2 family, partial [uncultured Rubrobacteraceae bacterium]